MQPASTRLPEETLADIQGFVTSGYGHLPFATYLFLQINAPLGGRRWVESLTSSITSSATWPVSSDGRKIKPASALNVAFTAAGFGALGLPPRVLCSFPAEFQEGIAMQHRSLVLGDTEASAPSNWELGGPDTPPVHAVLIVHGATLDEADLVCDAQRRLIAETSGVVMEISSQVGYRPQNDREPFGFHDGMGQPSIQGISGRGVPTGEFILGYLNHYGILPPTPVVPGDLDSEAILPPWGNPFHASEALRDLGLNGSYVVYRKLQQDVAGFWQFMKQEAVRLRGEEDAAYMVWLASRLVGRWPSGAPLMMTPHSDDPRLGGRDDSCMPMTRMVLCVPSGRTSGGSTLVTSSSRTGSRNHSACRRRTGCSAAAGYSVLSCSTLGSSMIQPRETASEALPASIPTARRVGSSSSASTPASRASSSSSSRRGATIRASAA